MLSFCRSAHPVSENQIDLISRTPTPLLSKQRGTGLNKTELSVLLHPKCLNSSGNVSETTSLVIKGDLFGADTRERIEHRENEEERMSK